MTGNGTVDNDLQAQVEGIAAQYPLRRSALMPALHLAQQKYGYLSEQAMREVADILELPAVQVYEVANFYTLFYTKPIGKYHLQLCTNISCMLAEAEKLLQHMQHRLAIDLGKTTPDGLFTLTQVECLGACDKAPVLQVNEDVFIEYLTEQKINDLIDLIKRNNPQAKPVDSLIPVINI